MGRMTTKKNIKFHAHKNTFIFDTNKNKHAFIKYCTTTHTLFSNLKKK